MDRRSEVGQRSFHKVPRVPAGKGGLEKAPRTRATGAAEAAQEKRVEHGMSQDDEAKAEVRRRRHTERLMNADKCRKRKRRIYKERSSKITILICAKTIKV